MQWYTFEPVDTLLFKGAEPMEMGTDHQASHLFPPPTQTIAGALRTAVLRQNNIIFSDYYQKKNVSEKILSAIGEAGSAAPFEIAGPLFQWKEQLYFPAPYSWFADKGELKKSSTSAIEVFKAVIIRTPLVKSENKSLLWTKGKSSEMKSLGGCWILYDDFFTSSKKKQVLQPDFFFSSEPRTGIALNKNRNVREGYLYTFTHIRFKAHVALVFGVDKDLPIQSEGIMSLGAEKRFGHYRKIKSPKVNKGSGGTFLSLSLTEGSEISNRTVLATGKIQYIGGWDLKEGDHKPMRGYFPPGTVYSQQIKPYWIQL